MTEDSIVPMRIGGRRPRPPDTTLQRLNLQILAIALLVICGFFYFEKIVGLIPCELCLRERLPWYAGLALALLFLIWHPRAFVPAMPILFGCLFLVSAGLAAHHVLVEQHLIAGPSACTASSGAGQSLEELKRRILATAPVHCDEIQWSLMGVSLAGWNVVASVFVVGLAAMSVRGRDRWGRE